MLVYQGGDTVYISGGDTVCREIQVRKVIVDKDYRAISSSHIRIKEEYQPLPNYPMAIKEA